MARRRSRRRKSSYRNEPEASGFPAELVIEDLSPRARRLVESGVIDLEMLAGSGEGGRITSGDILHAARVMEVEQSVARIEAAAPPEVPVEPESEPQSTEFDELDPGPDANEQQQGEMSAEPPVEAIPEQVAEISDAGATSAARVGGDPLAMPPDPWNAYNGKSEGLAESALPGAEQSWGEAEANIAAIAEEAAAQVYGREDGEPRPTTMPDSTEPRVVAEQADGPIDAVPDFREPEADGEPSATEDDDQPTAVVSPLSEAEAVVDAEDLAEPLDEVVALRPEPSPVDSATGEQTPDEPVIEQHEAMMDFGTLEIVDPVSVWAEGAEDFAPWFLAHSRQLGDVLGLNAGLSEARQFTTKSATGVVGRDDKGEDVVVVSSQNAEADDSDLGRALGMAASSGASTVALVSAKFHDEQLQALSWLNSQTRSGVQWYAIEMRVVRIADSPAAMLFDLVASPPAG